MQAAWIVEFSPDGKLIATGSEDSTVRLWDTATGSLVRSFNGHSRGIWALTFSEDGSQLASASIDNTVIVWDAATGDKIQQFETEVVKDDAHGNPNITYNEDFDDSIPARSPVRRNNQLCYLSSSTVETYEQKRLEDIQDDTVHRSHCLVQNLS
ncbi:hypothetical protein SI65_09969 [Aspergillus cristatus]|uniref:Uncharacterized protein n=1 Tax=Aspergillus cristatus TaxID=573508 RepID=A0A1E3B121_ASPCR|nr:hypothetical protein SI65_09969 [Aspergillus cristatus]